MYRYRYPSRRVVYDAFHGDPFKINSYNFRYADKPTYPPQQYQRPAPPPIKKPSFQTFFVNPKFGQGSERPPPNRNVPANRPRFLQEFQAAIRQPLRTMASSLARQPSVPVTPQLRNPSSVTDSPLLRTCCQMGEYQSLRTTQSIATLASGSSCSMRARGGATPRISGTTFSRGSNFELQPKRDRDRDASNGCEININICNRDSNSEADNNVSIRIEADACLLNNTDTVRPQLERIPHGSDDSLTASFGIDKRLSKFNVTETKPRTSPEWKRQQMERAKEQAREEAREQARKRDRQFREELELEREIELQKERERVRQRDREREQFREQDRQRDLEHLRELEAVRERQRLEELKRESQRHREYHRMCMFQDQLHRQRMQPVPAVPTCLPIVPPIPIPIPVVPMTSHLYTVTSDDRLPGMAFCDLSTTRRDRPMTPRRSVKIKPADPVAQEIPTACASCSCHPVDTPISQNTTPSSPTPSCSTIPRSASPDQNSKPTPTVDASTSSRSLFHSEIVPEIHESLACSSSFSSNDNIHVIEKSSGYLAKESSAQPLTETKHLNGRPPIVTRLNNIPIRITTSRQADFSMNHVRVRASSPVARGSVPHRQASQDACHVNINLFPDQQHVMRI
ncbi:J domain-containing protein DDB_G0295729 [Drosophila serrata]|uniref:J domain-containing protein DDB_G0295729 n=1 Tax=Drosophila serrata TaxID=7274 RepID=UPI000A1CF47D|nr:J domain-containing protein DDB_G0295729 [Drosophila serrata]